MTNFLYNKSDMREKDENKGTFYINHKLELLAWLIVILVLVGIFSLSYIHREKNDINDYQIFMPDVDGLIVGSPVRIMGIEVGHIVKIKPVHDEVYVKFIITNPNVTVPQGTKATVEFSGMAGSKSLELYLPDNEVYIDENVPLLTITPPKRLHDAISLLDDMFNRIGAMITTASIFGNNLKRNVDFPSGGNPEDMAKFLKYADNMIEKSNNMSTKIGGMFKDGRVKEK